MIKLRVLDLFSGIGGFSLGLERTGGFETVAFCEIEPFCRAVLEKHWPQVRQYEDVRALDAARLQADGIHPDVICGGFPCQDVSSAGLKAGLDGQRSGLWGEYRRLVGELRPSYVIVENVAALLSRGLGRVLGDLAALGYDAEWHSISASFTGLPQSRPRVWIVAYPDSRGREGLSQRHRQRPVVVVRHDDDRLDMGQRRARNAVAWVRRGDDGLPGRAHRLAALGNAVVPQIPELIGRAILQARAA